MSTKFFTGQKDYIDKLNELDDLFTLATGNPATSVAAAAAAQAARDAALAAASAAQADRVASTAAASSAAASSTNVTTKAGEVVANAQTVASQKTAADASATAANLSAIAAEASRSAAATSATNVAAASTAATNAASDSLANKTASAASASAALTSKTDAAAALLTAVNAAGGASTSETNALASKNASATNATTATNAASAAAADRLLAVNSASAVVINKDITVTKAGEAATSATNAATSASNAQGFQNTANFSSSSAAASAANAAISNTNAKIASDSAVANAAAIGGATAILANTASAAASQAAAIAAAAQGASSAAQSAASRDLAIQAWGAATAPSESLASISKTIHNGAIVKAIIYDTAKDSDGGAWRKRCQDKSWFTETLGGTTWLGQAANELAARGDNLIANAENLELLASDNSSAIDSNVIAAPDGTVTADKLKIAQLNSAAYRYAGISVVAGQRYAISAYFKQGDSPNFNAYFNNSGPDQLKFNINTGAILVVGANISNANIALDRFGFWKVTCVYLAPATGTFYVSTLIEGTGASVGQGHFVWGLKANQVGVLASAYSASPELLSNGNFDNGMAGWGASATGSSGAVSNSQLTVTGTATNVVQGQYATYPCVIGKTYRVSIDLISASTTNRYLVVSLGSSAAGTALSNSNFVIGANFLTFVATGTTHSVHACVYSVGDTIVVDNISIKEVTVLATPYVPYSALVNNYYQNTTDNKFYSLNATYGQTEVFRGNAREFPEQVAIIIESARLIIYDLTQPGCPMWLAFAYPIATYTPMGYEGKPYTSICAINGVLYVADTHVGNSTRGVREINFISDTIAWINSGPCRYWTGIANRRTNIGVAETSGLLLWPTARQIVSAQVNDIVATVLDNAPIDAATGLPVPTIAVATAGGVSVIKDDNTVVNITGYTSSAVLHVSFLPDGRLITGGDYSDAASVFAIPTTSVAASSSLEVYGFPNGKGVSAGQVSNANSRFVRDTYSSALGIARYKRNPSAPTKGIVATISSTYNTGWQIGDARAIFLADTVAESVVGSGELVTNGTFDVDTSGWTSGLNAPTLSTASGAMRVTFTANGAAVSYQAVTCIVGKTYRANMQFVTKALTGSMCFNVGSSSTNAAFGQVQSNSAGMFSTVFVATQATIYIAATSTASALSGEYFDVDNISVKLVVADRSSKNIGAVVNGTLTKTAVATGAQLVAYNGWSAANYAQQSFNSNLDFGTGEWDVNAWVNYTTGPAGNIVSYPEELNRTSARTDNGAWAINNAVAPDGTTTADSLTGSGVGATRFNILDLMTVYGAYLNVSITVTVCVKSVDTVRICLSENIGGISAVFDPRDGTFISASSSSVSVMTPISISLGNGWYRVGYTRLRYGIYEVPIFGFAGSYADTTPSTGTVSFWGLTYEFGKTFTPYVPGAGLLDTTTRRSLITERSATSGPSIKVYGTLLGNLAATAFDGTTTRTVTSPLAYNTGIPTLANATYRADGSLALLVNGSEVARATGAPLLTLNSASPRHNLILNSHTFQPQGGGPSFHTYVTDIAFDGTNTASRLTVVGSRSFIEYSAIANTPSVFSLYIRRVSGAAAMTMTLKESSSDTIRGTATFTANTLWQRISVSGISTNGGVRIELAGFSVDDIYWGAQLEQGTTVAAAYQRVGTTVSDYDTTVSVKAALTVGNSRTLDAPFPGSIALLRVSATAPSADQSAFIYRTELPLFAAGAQCTIDGTSTSVTAMAYDENTEVLHVGTSWGRTAFRNLLRIESAVTTMGAITSLAANQGAHVTAGASAGRYYQPALLLRDELRRKDEARKALGKVVVFFEYDAIAAQTAFLLPKGYTVKAVYAAGTLKRIGSTKDYTVSNDGFAESVVFAVSPGAAAWVSVMAVRS